MKEKDSESLHLTLCFLTKDTMCPNTSPFLYYAFPGQVVLYAQIVNQDKPIGP